MSSGTNNFTPTTRRNQQVGLGDYYGPYRQSPVPRYGSASFRTNPDVNGGAHYPWQSFEDRVVPGPFSLTGFPVQIPIIGNLRARDVRPSRRQIIQGPPSGFMNRNRQNNIHPVQEGDSRLNQNEQKSVLNKLKKEIYNPGPKRLARRLSLYYRDEAKNVYNQMEKLKEDDAMRCAVCLEDFEPQEKVMLTPCNHMFHEDCIVPWVKSHAQCPVCRFSLGESRSASDNNNIANVAAASEDDLFARELMSVIRIMEESYIWNNASH